MLERAEEIWSEPLSEALAEGFDAAYEELLGRAAMLWPRKTPPLDEAIEAWIAYQQHVVLAEAPTTARERLGVTRGDELRLGRLWRERIASDPALQERAAVALENARTLPEPRFAQRLGKVPFPPSALAGLRAVNKRLEQENP